MSTYFQEDEITGKAYDARLLRRLLRYLRPYRRSVLAAVALLLLASVSDLAGPYLFKVAIDRYIAAGQLAGLGRLAAVYLAVLLLHAVFRYAQSVLMQVVGQRAMYDLRMELFAHVERLSLSFFTRHPVGRLMTRLTNDVDALNELVTQGVVAIFGDFFMLAGIVVALLLLDWRLALVVFTVLPLLVGMAYGFQVRVRESYRAIRLRLARINAYLNEHIMGVAVMQLFNRERRAFARFDGLNRDHLEASLRAVRFYALFWPAVSVAEALAGALIIWYGGGEVVQKTLTLGTLVAFIEYANRFFRPIQDLSEKYNILQAAMASSERIFRLMDEPVEVPDPPAPRPLARVRGEVEFRDVWFAYPPHEGRESFAGGGEPAAGTRGAFSAALGAAADWVLRGVSFHVRPGESVAIVGYTGAGKTSIINLLFRFYDPQRGQVMVDGVDVREVVQRDLRRHLGLVLQEVFLFSGTVASNIRLGTPSITDADVRRAAVFTNAHRFIERLPRGYDTEVQERGAILSGGERQLIAFARALAHNPEIVLVLDEATSSVDTETEAVIRETLRKVLHGRTSIIIAHRLSTIQHVDRILVLHKGRVVEEGTHQALLARRGIYWRLYQLQYRDQERREARLGAGGEGAGV